MFHQNFHGDRSDEEEEASQERFCSEEIPARDETELEDSVATHRGATKATASRDQRHQRQSLRGRRNPFRYGWRASPDR